LATLVGISIVGTAIYLNFPLDQLFLLIFIPLGLLSLFGAVKKNDLRIFPYLLVVIPSQIIGYGIGFIQAFIRRFVFQQDEMVGFKKNYYK
jgi:hypothetical protein